jgi:hypothetical protein
MHKILINIPQCHPTPGKLQNEASSISDFMAVKKFE